MCACAICTPTDWCSTAGCGDHSACVCVGLFLPRWIQAPQERRLWVRVGLFGGVGLVAFSLATFSRFQRSPWVAPVLKCPAPFYGHPQHFSVAQALLFHL
jgi:hypothetical protein